MTKDEIIRMAREAGHAVRNIDGDDEVMDGDNYHIQTDLIERFAALVAAAERNILAAWMIQRSYATGHGDTIEDLLKQLEWQIAEREREACAKVCDELAARDKLSNYYAVAAKAIRARGDKPTSVIYSPGQLAERGLTHEDVVKLIKENT